MNDSSRGVMRDDYPSGLRSSHHFHKVKVDRRVATRYPRETDTNSLTVAIGGMH